jgi:DNA-binding protein H-NS
MDLELVENVETTEPAPTPAPTQSTKSTKRQSAKLTDTQKAGLNKHMEKMKKDGMTPSEMKSHRMKLMSRMRRDPKMTAKKAHNAVMKG